MRSDYQTYFNKLKKSLHEIGAICLEEHDLRAIFLLSSGWRLSFDCERYYGPSWSISIASPDGKCYAVWILMRVFENLTDNIYGPATIEGQVDFIAMESARIFGDVGFYSSEYDKFNLDI